MKNIKMIFFLILALTLTACSNSGDKRPTESLTEQVNGNIAEQPDEIANKGYTMTMNDTLMKTTDISFGYGTTYEVFVYSYYDSDGDGIGDFNGLTSKLDYISDLGFDGLWLMPVMPSPTYHKYDVTDYFDIDPEYGTLADFENFIAACNERGIRVIIDLVINHSSSQHPWFLEACEYLAGLDGAEPDIAECPSFDYYNFSREKKSKYYLVPGTDDWYYEAQFWSEMPDLNLASDSLKGELSIITAFWFDKGVDGFRLDAAKEFFTGSPQLNTNLLTWFNQMVKAQKPDAYLVAEIWESAPFYAPYYESGIDSIFNFTFGDKNGIIAATVNGIKSASGLGSQMADLDALCRSYNPDYIDAPFYTNHDMGRGAGYYNGEYAVAQAKVAMAINLLMSGNTFTYYGDELGMTGAGKDENKRVGMLWSDDPDAEGMCQGPPDKDTFNLRYPSYEVQKDDPYSIYHYIRNAVKVRNAYPEIIRGRVTNLDDISTDTLAAFIKTDGDNQCTILINISPENALVKLAGIAALNGNTPEQTKVKAVLLTNEEPITIIDDLINIPPYGIVILD
ncbi:MAG: alpha-amylase family glycosyl hydrolase [Lachnospiraceae bacterium]|nr:alpha-amylase family glycosyl hydrolase [Lachnospiraceae bacterium]